jgi:hypothetical protein
LIVAKRASSNGASKSEAIRTYKSSHEDAGPTAIAAALTKEGTKVTPAFVSTVLSNAKRKGGKGRRKMGRRKMVRRGRRPAVASRHSSDPVDRLIQAKKLAEQMGGVEQARAALDALARILA